MTGGHWRKLQSSNHTGKDQYGMPVRGKTWVKRKSKIRGIDLTLKVPEEIKAAPVVEPKKKSLAQVDLDLWNKWKKSGSEEDLVVLMNRFKGSIAQTLYVYKDAPVPPSVVEASANIQVLNAIKSFDPKGGSTLNQWVNGRLKGVGKVVGKYQNVGKIPEHRRIAISKYNAGKEELEDLLGHEPSAQKLAEHLGWSIAECTRMEKELSRRDLIASKHFDPDSAEEYAVDEAFEKNVFRKIYYALEDEKERLVFEHTIGYNGKEELPAGGIAKKLNIHPSKVSRIRKKIDKMFDRRGM